MVKPIRIGQADQVADQSWSPVGDSHVELVRDFSVCLELPPSTNKLYIKRKGGGVALSMAAKKYKRSVQKVMGEPRNVAHLARFPVDPETRYSLRVVLYFPMLENPGWFEFWEKNTYVTRGKHKGELKGRKGERKAKTRYKVVDYDNRIKFMQDCLVEGIGINDCQIFHGEQEKREDPDNPRAEVYIKVLHEGF